MKKNIYYLTNDIGVHRQSIIDLPVSTQDTDGAGYLITNGTNRSMQAGISERGDITIWISTNGDPIALYEVSDDPDGAVAAAITMGDVEDDYQARAQHGVTRILAAISILREMYAGNDDAAVSIDWYATWCAEVRAILYRDDAITIAPVLGVDDASA